MFTRRIDFLISNKIFQPCICTDLFSPPMSEIIFPSSLKKGDTVRIVATARKISLEEIQPAIDVLNSWELNVEVGESIGKENFQLAGSDEERLHDFQNAMDDNSVKAIICARGGYGTVRIIDEVDFRKFSKNPKWICGYSDITVIHSHLLSVYNTASLHCTMPVSFSGNTPESLQSMKSILFGEKNSEKIPANKLNREGIAAGKLCGGNLSLLQNLSGTVSDIDTTDRILFFEDVDEYLYHFDRMIQWLKRSGKLENLVALVVGHLSKMKNLDEKNPFGKSAEEIIADAVGEYDYPVCFGYPAGHENDNRALMIGGNYSLTINSGWSELKMT